MKDRASLLGGILTEGQPLICLDEIGYPRPHDFRVLREGYFKENPIAGYKQDMSYATLFCAKCGETRLCTLN